MNKQIHLFGLNTKAFYSEEESKIDKRIKNLRKYLDIVKEYEYAKAKLNEEKSLIDYYKLKLKYNKLCKNKTEEDKAERNRLYKYFENIKELIKADKDNDKSYLLSSEMYQKCNNKINELNNEIKELFIENKNNPDSIRELNINYIYCIDEETEEKKYKIYNQIAIQESYLTRVLELTPYELTTDIFVIENKNVNVSEDIVTKGFNFDGEKYRFFIASAGMIKDKKYMIIKESTYLKYEKTLFCGLTLDKINELGGCNINKYLSYCGLISSSTEQFEFDIDRAIVIDDFESEVEGQVDFIETKNEIIIKNKNINHKRTPVAFEQFTMTGKVKREPRRIKITHSDGCGWVLYDKEKNYKNYIIRLPFIKGLVTPVRFLDYARKANNYKVIDIYGKEWNILKDNIQYIFTKSQFKMAQFYKSWEEYKEAYKVNTCHASRCKLEPDVFDKKVINYQMLQTLTDITKDEKDILVQDSYNTITKAYTNIEAMLKVLDIDEDNQKNNNLQKAINLYPQLLKTPYVKDMLSKSIQKYKNNIKYGRIEVEAKRSYILPDVYAWLQHVFGKIDENSPIGLLQNGEVSCRLYKKESKIAVLRSPHLYKEWAVRKNVTKNTDYWFTTNAVYTSRHDLISRILQNDCDGDEALIVANTPELDIIDIAERSMKDIVPLYYEMGKAKPEEINNYNIFKGMKTAWSEGGIGQYSNLLTKFWNSKNRDNMDIAKIMTAMNNYTIDCSKTLLKPVLSKDWKYYKEYMEIKKQKMPFFYKYNSKHYYIEEEEIEQEKTEEDKKKKFKKKKKKTTKKNNKEIEVQKYINTVVNYICKRFEDVKRKHYNFSELGSNFSYKKLMNKASVLVDKDTTNKIIEKYKKLDSEKNKHFSNAKTTKNEIAPVIYNNIKKELEEYCLSINVNISDAIDTIIRHEYTTGKNDMKSFLFVCFGDIIVKNLMKNMDNKKEDKTFLCSCCNKPTKRKSNRQTMCSKCAGEKIREKDRSRKHKKVS